jgi:epoxyqueuosine reductase
VTRLNPEPRTLNPLSPTELTSQLKAQARALGFTLAGVCAAVTPTGASRLGEWLERGYAGQMDYIAARQHAYDHPRHVLEGVRSVLMLGLPYRTVEPQPTQPGQGRVSRYAWGDGDYHDVIHDRLRKLIDWLKERVPAAQARGVVDTAPLLEREFAQLAGLGWIGKHTLLINKPAGSYFFLAALLTDQELASDEPFTADHCGTCRACLDACPTQAFPQPYVLDATRCISYLTIELRESIPADLRPGIGDWLFGCDVCQDVCPWNQASERKQSRFLTPSGTGSGEDADVAIGLPVDGTIPVASGPSRREGPTNHPELHGGQAAERHGGRSLQDPVESAFIPADDANPVDLLDLFDLDDEAFRRRFRHTPLWRAKRRGILRNAAIVLGNQKAVAAAPALRRGLQDSEPIVREACAWALARIEGGGGD